MPPNERQTLLLYRAKRKNLIRDRRERRAQDLDSSNDDDDVGPARRLLLVRAAADCCLRPLQSSSVAANRIATLQFINLFLCLKFSSSSILYF